MRITWIDTIRGISMMAILLFHTEVYYTGQGLIPYHLYVTNALIAFFFVSGYLFHHPDNAFSIRHKLTTILRKLVIPYFIFTIILAIPKAMVHDDMSFTDVFMSILTGKASWFVATLIIAEIIFAAIIYYFQHLKEPTVFILSTLPYLLIAAAYHFLSSETLVSCNLWCWQNALLILPFLYMGYYLRRNKHLFDKITSKKAILFLFVGVVILKYWEHQHQFFLTMEPIIVTSFFILLLDGIITTLFLIAICRIIPNISPITWTGKHSLVYYFFCGAVPTAISMGLLKVGFIYDGQYWHILVAFLLVYLLSTFITWGVYKVIRL